MMVGAYAADYFKLGRCPLWMKRPTSPGLQVCLQESIRSADDPRGPPAAGISEFSAVIGPMQQRLPLTLPAEKIARLAIHLQLPYVPADRGPALDLSCIFVRKPPAPIIAAVPLKPAARVFAMDPA